jgi:TRAP-type mannitol/chloroaromatic compound transport system permease small subunit
LSPVAFGRARESMPNGGKRVKLSLALSTAIDAMNEKLGWIADWSVLLSCVVSALNAFVRYGTTYIAKLPAAIADPILWGISATGLNTNAALESQWYMFAAMVLLGGPFTLKMNEHVRVDLIYASVSERKQLWIDAIGFAVFLLPVMTYLTWLCWPFFWTSFLSGEGSTNAGGLILWPVKLMIPLGFALMWLQGLSELIKRIAALRGIRALETKYVAPQQ